MFIGMEDIAGIHKGSQIICMDCIDDDTLDAVELENDIITRAEVDSNGDGFFFCDSCKKAL